MELTDCERFSFNTVKLICKDFKMLTNDQGDCFVIDLKIHLVHNETFVLTYFSCQLSLFCTWADPGRGIPVVTWVWASPRDPTFCFKALGRDIDLGIRLSCLSCQGSGGQGGFRRLRESCRCHVGPSQLPQRILPGQLANVRMRHPHSQSPPLLWMGLGLSSASSLSQNISVTVPFQPPIHPSVHLFI